VHTLYFGEKRSANCINDIGT